MFMFSIKVNLVELGDIMKKILMMVLFASAVTGFVSAEGFDFGEFPLGKWMDSNYDAIWEFQSNNLRIVSSNGDVYYDFDGKTITKFKLAPTTEGITLSFYCEETEKNYKFIKGLSNVSLNMEIVKDSGLHYGIALPIVK